MTGATPDPVVGPVALLLADLSRNLERGPVYATAGGRGRAVLVVRDPRGWLYRLRAVQWAETLDVAVRRGLVVLDAVSEALDYRGREHLDGRDGYRAVLTPAGRTAIARLDLDALTNPQRLARTSLLDVERGGPGLLRDNGHRTTRATWSSLIRRSLVLRPTVGQQYALTGDGRRVADLAAADAASVQWVSDAMNAGGGR